MFLTMAKIFTLGIKRILLPLSRMKPEKVNLFPIFHDF